MHIILLLSLIAVYLWSGNISSDNPRTRKKCAIGMGVCLFLFAALRSWTVGSDTWNYFDDFYIDTYLSYAEIPIRWQGREPFFHFFSHTVSLISHDPQFFMAVIAAFVATGFSIFAYHQKGNLLMIYGLFVTLRIYSFTCSGLRQAMAMSFIFVAFVLIEKRRILYALPLIIIATLFHTSAFLSALMIPLVLINKNKIIISSMLFGGVINIMTGGKIASTVSQFLFLDKYSGYLANDFAFTASSTFVLYVTIFIILLASHKMLSSNDVDYWPNMRILSAAIMLSMLGQSLPNLFRLTYYFIFPLFSMFAYWIDKKNSNSRLFQVAIYLVLSIQYVVLGAGADVDNYEFFWENTYLY